MLHLQKISAALVLMLLLGSCSCRAGSVGRQRRVHTSATSTGASQLAGFGLPLWHATYASNDEYIEAPLKRIHEDISGRSNQEPQQLSLEPQPQQLWESPARSAAGAVEQVNLVDLLPATELTAAQVQQLLLLNEQKAGTTGEQQVRFLSAGGSNSQGEGRIFGGPKIIVVMPASNSSAGAPINVTNINRNILNNTAAEPASGTTTTTRFVAPNSLRSPLPVQYFETRQGQNAGANLVGINAGLRLPYSLVDLNQGALYGNGLSAAAPNGAVPLVPVTLGNNAVGYVPLNLRMFRQLADGAAAAAAAGLPIRESDDDIAAVPLKNVEPEPESEEEISDAEATAQTAEKATGASRLQLFAQRLRQRPVAAAPASGDSYMRTPIISFAKSLRRLPYL
ncbi:hypothetical protein KR222_000265 [Zaprionus bogoriensis]|nr:hypothetical protein KR222_000265 [Zaprionus bogoriensis]